MYHPDLVPVSVTGASASERAASAHFAPDPSMPPPAPQERRVTLQHPFSMLV